jgi:hypothetical protein
MKFAKFAVATALLVVLSGCADSISKPVALMPITSEKAKAVQVANIQTDADAGTPATHQDCENISDKIKTYIQQGSPGVIVDAGTADALTMKVHITRFDRGSAVARAILIGLGQIHIDAEVTLQKADGTVAGKYTVKKTFALGGIAGAATRIEDVEEGFAKSVAEVVKTKTES